MKKLNLSLLQALLLVIFTIPVTVSAQSSSVTAQPKGASVRANPSSIQGKTVNEDWYLFIDWGLTNDSFGGEIKEKRDDINAFDTSNSDKSTGGFGTSVAFYFPLDNKRTMIGPYISYGISTYDIENLDEGQEFDVTTTRFDLAFSGQHFFGPAIGEGFFLRGDLGVSSIELEVEKDSFCFFDCDTRSTINFRDGETWQFDSFGQSRSIRDTSLMALVGTGFSWGVGKGTRMQLLLSHTLRPSSIGRLDTTNLALGMLF